MGSGFVAPSAKTNETLRAVVYATKLLPRDLRNDINKQTRALGNQLWRPAVTARAVSKMDRAVLAKGSRVKPGNPMSLIAASSKRALKGGGGLVPDRQWRGFEFGSSSRQNKREYERKNRSGSGTHTVSRRTQKQMPQRKPAGRVVYQAAADIAPRISAMVVQTTVRRIQQAHRGEA